MIGGTPQAETLARSFHRLGWLGVVVQAVLALNSVVLLAWAFVGAVPGARPMGRTGYLALVGLAILLFTTFWSYRYVTLGARMREPDRRPTRAAVVSTLWIGLWASGLGIAVSMLMLVVEVTRLVILVLRTPQAGVPVMQLGAETAAWVSAIDVVSLLADVSTLGAELLVFGVTLWLLFRVTRVAADAAPAASTSQ